MIRPVVLLKTRPRRVEREVDLITPAVVGNLLDPFIAAWAFAAEALSAATYCFYLSAFKRRRKVERTDERGDVHALVLGRYPPENGPAFVEHALILAREVQLHVLPAVPPIRRQA